MSYFKRDWDGLRIRRTYKKRYWETHCPSSQIFHPHQELNHVLHFLSIELDPSSSYSKHFQNVYRWHTIRLYHKNSIELLSFSNLSFFIQNTFESRDYFCYRFCTPFHLLENTNISFSVEIRFTYSAAQTRMKLCSWLLY